MFYFPVWYYKMGHKTLVASDTCDIIVDLMSGMCRHQFGLILFIGAQSEGQQHLWSCPQVFFHATTDGNSEEVLGCVRLL